MELGRLLSRWAERSSLTLASSQADPFPDDLQEIDALLDQFTPPSLIAALKRLDQLWAQGDRHPLLMERAARGLVLLTIQSGGLQELNDRLAGRALALLALAGEGYALQNIEAEEALLAQHLGYRGHAFDAASQLPVDHPVRLYLQGSVNDLRQAAEQASPKESALVRYLHLKRLAQAGLSQDWAFWARRHFPELQMALPVLNSHPQQEADSDSLWERVLDLSRVELARAADDLNPGLEKLFPPFAAVAPDWTPEKIRPMLWQGGQASAQEFESLLSQLEGLYPGPFLDAPALVSYHASPFYFALLRLANLSLRQHACFPAFPLDDPFLSIASAGERAARLQAWYQKRSMPNRSDPARRGAKPDEFDLFDALDSLLPTVPFHDRRLVAAAQRTSSRLDSRPAHRPAHCQLRSSLGLKALAEGFHAQAANWFESLEKAQCGLVAPPRETVQLIRQSRTGFHAPNPQ